MWTALQGFAEGENVMNVKVLGGQLGGAAHRGEYTNYIGDFTYRLFGPNGVIWTSKITLHKRKFGRPPIRTVQNYG